MRVIADEVQLLWDSWCQDPDKFLDRRAQNHSLEEFSKNKGHLRLQVDAVAVRLWPADFILKSDSQKQLWIQHETTPSKVFRRLEEVEKEVKRRDEELKQLGESLPGQSNDWHNAATATEGSDSVQMTQGHELQLIIDSSFLAACQLYFLDLWRSFVTYPEKWSADKDRLQNSTRYLVHKRNDHQLNVNDASTPAWAKQEFMAYQVTLIHVTVTKRQY